MCEIQRTWDYVPGAPERDPRSNHAAIMSDIEKVMSAGKTLGFVNYNLTTDNAPPISGSPCIRYTLTIGRPEDVRQ